MIGRRIGSRAALTAALAGAVLLGDLSPAEAAKPSGKDAEAARIEQKALNAAADGDMKAAIGSLTLALLKCDAPNGCSATTRARLHVTLATVRGVGENDYVGAKKEFVAALALDPQAQLSNVQTPELVAAFEEAKSGKTSSTPAAPPTTEKTPPSAPDKPVTVTDLVHQDEKPPPPPPPPKKKDEPPPPPPGPKIRKNWLSLRAQFDFSLLTDANICSPGAPSSYYCTDEEGKRYDIRPQPNDEVSKGFAFSMPRLVLGYERVFFDNFTFGAFAGIAFNLAPTAKGRADKASPLHFEARATYTFGDDPYADGSLRFSPFVFVAVGAADENTHVKIRVNEVPCSQTVAPSCSRELDAFRLVGGIYTSLGGGVRFQIEDGHAIRAGVRGTLLFGGGFIAAPDIGYEFGF